MAKETKLNKVIPETYNSSMREKTVKVYPTFRVGDDELPELSKMEVGSKHKLELEVEVLSKSQGSDWDQNSKDKSIRATLKVIKIGCDMDEDDKKEKGNFEMDYAKRRSGGTGSRFDKKA